MTLSRDEFNRQCIQFVGLCQSFQDDWILYRSNGQPLRLEELDREHQSDLTLMLSKKSTRRNLVNQRLCHYEYSVVYSDSYEVPVLYFSVSDQNGSYVPLGELVRLENEDLSRTINQVEHPMLFRPFNMIHPCRTRDFMEPHVQSGDGDYLITWLSTVSTLVDLQLDPKFGLMVGKR